MIIQQALIPPLPLGEGWGEGYAEPGRGLAGSRVPDVDLNTALTRESADKRSGDT
jgi:hypothetical protein